MRNFRKRIIFAFVLVVLLLAIGTVYYNVAEGWSYVDSFYFSTMTLTTIGFGDLTPTTDGAKIVTSFYAIFGIGIISAAVVLLIFLFIIAATHASTNTNSLPKTSVSRISTTAPPKLQIASRPFISAAQADSPAVGFPHALSRYAIIRPALIRLAAAFINQPRRQLEAGLHLDIP